MSFLLAAALLMLMTITVILFRNMATFSSLEEADPAACRLSAAVCVPARNEQHVIERCVTSLLSQDYPHCKIYVLDDNSTDATGRILQALQEQHPEKLMAIAGRPKPGDWLGKPWACHQLSLQAEADILIFADADTWLEPNAVSRTLAEFDREDLDCLTIWPEQELRTFWENMLIPLVYYALVGFLPSVYIRRPPRWLPARIEARVGPLFAAACGQFMAFRKQAYDAIGGHRSVRQDVVEDVALARHVKRNGYRMNMYNGLDTVHCRMYENEKAIREGFRKNFLAGFGSGFSLFLMAGLLHLILYVFPVFTFIQAQYQDSELISGLSAMCISLFLLHRFILALWFRWPVIYVLLHPLSVLWYQFLALIVLWDYLTGRSPTWKGRTLKN